MRAKRSLKHLKLRVVAPGVCEACWGLVVCGCVLCCAHLRLWRAFCAGVVETLLGVCDFSGVGCAWGTRTHIFVLNHFKTHLNQTEPKSSKQ